MNNREQSRYEKYIQQYPILATNRYKEQLIELCQDPKIGYPPLKDNQRQYRSARKQRDEKVYRLYEEACKQHSELN